MSENALSKYYTNIKAGAELIQTLSASLYKNALYVFDELISNAYDADATQVNIELNDEQIIISDNGVGMDKESLENYLWLGYSEKQRDRQTKKLGRYTIGKFGIGKLSMHVICDVFIVETTKIGITRALTLDFKKILSHRGLEDEKIEVLEYPSDNRAEGTIITLNGLKKRIDEDRAIRRIMRNMPLSPKFQIVFNGKILKPEDIIKGKEYTIDLNLPLSGKINGKIIHSDSPLGEFAGIYVKVYGRTVNSDDPNLFDLMNTIKRPGTFVARLYGIIFADSLDDIVLATRNGFYEDSLKFLEFREAIIKEIRRICGNIIQEQSQEELHYEKRLLEDIVRHQINKMLENVDLPDDFIAKYSKRPDAEVVKASIKKAEQSREIKERQKEKENEPDKKDHKSNPIQEGRRLLRIGRKRYKFELESMGKEAYECILDAQKAIFYINIDHPQYIFSRKEGSITHHFRRVIVF